MRIRETKQLKEIQKEIDKTNTFFTAEELHKNLKQIGIATIYRYLNELEKTDKLYAYLCDRRKIYSKQKNSHCHFHCEKTGKTFHFEIKSLDFLKNKIPGSIKSIQIEVKGICKDCTN